MDSWNLHARRKTRLHTGNMVKRLQRHERGARSSVGANIIRDRAKMTLLLDHVSRTQEAYQMPYVCITNHNPRAARTSLSLGRRTGQLRAWESAESVAVPTNMGWKPQDPGTPAPGESPLEPRQGRKAKDTFLGSFDGGVKI